VRTQFSVLALCFLALLCTLPVGAQSSHGTTLTLTVAPECSIGIVSLSLGSSNSQTVTFNYKLRTAGAGGQGQITLRFTTAGATIYPDGSEVDYETSLAGPGTPSSGTIPTANALISGIVIARFGPEAHSSHNGATGTVQIKENPAPLLPFKPLRPSFSISCQ
jgi:hypothetical protein